MSSKLDSSIETVDLDRGVSPDNPVEIPVPRGGEFEVRAVDGTAYMRFNNRQQERRPVRPGETICWGGGDVPITKILLDNDAGDQATVEYEVRYGFTVRGFGGRPQGALGNPPGPRRLQGDLAPGTVVAVGDEPSVVVDTELAEELRFRVRASGQADFQADGQVSPAGTRPIVVDEDADLAFGAEEFSPLVGAVDISDPSNPVQTDTVDPSTAQADISHVVGLGIDPENDQLLVVVYDNTNNDLETVRVSYDASGTLTIEDHQQVGSMPLPARDEPGAAVALPGVGSNDATWVVAAGTGGLPGDGLLALIDYDYAAPAVTVTTVLDSQHVQAVAVDRSRGLVVTGNGADGSRPTVWEVTSGTSMIIRDTLDGEVGALQRDSAMDPDRELLAVFITNPDRLAVVDYSNPDDLTIEADVEDVGGVSVGGYRSAAFLSGGSPLLAVGSYGGGVVVLDLSTPSDPALVDSDTTPQNDTYVRWYDAGSGVWVLAGDGARDFHTFETVGSRDVLTVYPLLSNGARAATGVESVDVPDGSEVLLDVDILGPDQVEVEYSAGGPNQAEIQYVEVAQE